MGQTPARLQLRCRASDRRALVESNVGTEPADYKITSFTDIAALATAQYPIAGVASTAL
jgi:hypothetical protein